jgi:hypothetical protein
VEEKRTISPARARMKQFLNRLGLSEGAFELSIGMSTGWVSNIGDNIRLKTLSQISKVYPNLNINWLTSGQGVMLYSDPQPRLEAKPIRLADPEGFEANGDRFYTLPDQTIIMQTPVIPVKAYGSYLRGHADPEFYEGLETMPVPVDIKHKGTYLIFEVEGDSMVNFTTAEFARKSIWPGQRVIGRDLRRDHWKYKLHINSTECWIIVHRERGIVIKSIIEHDVDKAEITLHSWNPDKVQHPDYTISLNDVDQIFNVVDPFNKR